ncbi:MAG: hypothetical protein K0Q70_1650 [Rhodospirillales bacterium]|jgi:hypothetical protein|nr:hypothetical protein [Rhodospirillales bacterium]
MALRRFVRTRLLPWFGGDKRPARLAFIETYRFPVAVQARFAAEQPDFNDEERRLVFDALKDYFAICAADPAHRAGMPSRIVDEAWHTFILFTRDYTEFCGRAFGAYLHHAPAGAAGNDDDVRHTWRVACARENIPATNPPRLPRLFGIDRQLAVPGARYYALNETDADRTRRILGANATISLAMAFGLLDSWNDPIFRDMPPRHDIGGGDTGTHFADAGGFDGADGGGSGGGCSGGGS